ncbi:glycosyltransferase family 9 protein [uncultured Massilia sp.]|uniref:glycosyltransferase family 9 protein n=1 Tax=uncultured Massilia sp. TaxID=169973 RepID=UPI0027D97238|nr:glycosyltransferase family 9 protein [uncultured Massilia sp.]
MRFGPWQDDVIARHPGIAPGDGGRAADHGAGVGDVAAPLVDPRLLERAGKILFVAHLALGDFTYLKACFEAFARAWPHLKIHLWVDERRRTRRAAAWEHLRKYALYDWLAACPYFDRVYRETYSPALLARSIAQARAESYPVVVSLAELERHRYARLARKLSPDGFVVGQKKRVRPYDLYKRLCYRHLDAWIAARPRAQQPVQHISDIYAGWFAQLFGLQIAPAARYPVLAIPATWTRWARDQCAAWGMGGADRADGAVARLVFLNAFAKSVERSWPLERTIELIHAMRERDGWRDAGVIVNVVPEAMARARALFAGRALGPTQLFSAQDNFFQLPAILARCDLAISVETAVMHLANAVHVPVIALMRRKTPEWAPIDRARSTVITVPGRNDWVERIGVADVLAALPPGR